jgi:membrane protein DedA with SNARE-associated domain
MLDLNHVTSLLLEWKYYIIFPLAVIEGPIITVIAGFLVSAGFLNFFLAYALIVTGDLGGDTIYYLIGRFVKPAFRDKYGKYIGLSKERLDKIDYYFREHPHKTFALGKLSHGVGTVMLVGAGIMKVPYYKFILANVLPTMIKSLILLLIGFYFGKFLTEINHYLDFGALGIGILFAAIYILYLKYSKKFNSNLK